MQLFQPGQLLPAGSAVCVEEYEQGGTAAKAVGRNCPSVGHLYAEVREPVARSDNVGGAFQTPGT